MKNMPSFFVVGAQKAGTTSLHDWLVQLPDICLPKLKETQYFAFESIFERGPEWYLSQFPDCSENQIVGEICPDYMFFEGSAERIKEQVGSPKIIFIFRHPLERAFSHYQMTVRNGFEDLSFHDALLNENERLNKSGEHALINFSYLLRGLYTKQIETYLECFPESSFMFIKFDDLIDRGNVGEETFRNICKFIGSGCLPDKVNREGKSNPASRPRLVWLRNFLYGTSSLKHLLGKIIPSKAIRELLAYKLDRINQHVISSPFIGKVPEEVLIKINEEIIQLQKLSGLDLNEWSERKYG